MQSTSFEEHRMMIVSRYHDYLSGLIGRLGMAMYSPFPLAESTKTELEIALNDVYRNALNDFDGIVENAVDAAVSLSYQIALNNDYAVSESKMSWDELTLMMRDAKATFLEELHAKMRLDVRKAIEDFNRFRLTVSSRSLSNEAETRHLIVSEREKILENVSFYFRDRNGRRYDPSFYVGKRVNYMMFSMQRETMYYLLLSMGEAMGKVYNPNGKNNGKVFPLADLFYASPPLFHYGSLGLVIKS